MARFALKCIGYPYVWAGEYPTQDSPYGTQKSGGFDCSGFVFYVMKMHFGYPITVNERGAHDMAARAKPRITRDKLKCGDLIFFGPKGPSSSVESIYHAALYLGSGWFIHSTGSSDGVTLASLNNSSYWKAAFAWGRRLLTPAELVLPDAVADRPGRASRSAGAGDRSPTPSPDAACGRRPSASVTPAPESSAPASPDPVTSATGAQPRRVCATAGASLSVLSVAALETCVAPEPPRPWALRERSLALTGRLLRRRSLAGVPARGGTRPSSAAVAPRCSASTRFRGGGGPASVR